MHFSNTTKGFYPSTLRDLYDAAGTWPPDAIVITEEVEATVRAALLRGDTIELDGNGGVVIVPKLPKALSIVKVEAYTAIDIQAGETRKKYITDVAGQSETYLLKASDAQAYKAAGYPVANIGLYPMVQAEAVAINGATPTAVQFQGAADYIIATQGQWLQLAANIEQQRRAGKEAAKAATTNEAVDTAKQAALVALLAL